MPDDSRGHFPARARPLADLPLEMLLGRTRQLARLWALGLARERSLDAIGEIPFEQLAREAPALCAQLLRALGSDSELELLAGREGSDGRGRSAYRLGVLAGAHDAAEVVDAVEALRVVIWEALLAELALPTADVSPRRLLDASDRLAHACSALLPAALAAIDRKGESPAAATANIALGGHDAASPASGASIVIIDEHRHGAQTESRSPERERLAAPEPVGVHEIEVRDERREEGAAAWIGSIGRQLERFEEDRQPFAVLLVELSHGRAQTGLGGALETALAGRLRELSGGSVTRERPGRYWLLAPRGDPGAVDELAQRLSSAVTEAGRAHGVKVSVTVGTAVCPQDGSQASSLAAHADIGLYAARSRSRLASLAATPTGERLS